jgi:chromosome partitioning protein
MQVRVAMGCVIAVGNQKGGVGKTTVAVHLAAALGERGYRCLLIDLDPAAGATRHLGVAENAYAGSLELLSDQESLGALVLAEDLPTGVHLVPSRPQLAELDTVLSKFVDRTRVLDRPLAVARDLYDYIILDTPPAAGAITTVAAYAASEWFLLSAFPHPLSVRGISEACADIADVRERRNPELEVLGIVFTNVDGRARRMRAEIDGAIGDLMPGRRFRTVIAQAVAVPESSGRGQTVFQHSDTQRLAVARQFRRLADEVEHRTHNREAFLGGTLGLPSSWTNEIPLVVADQLSRFN